MAKRQQKIIISMLIACMFGLGLISNVLVDFRLPEPIEKPNTAASVAWVGSDTPDGTYGVGMGVIITMNFTEVVFVTGFPQIRLETGVNDGVANYTGGNATCTLRFYYAIQAGHNSLDLDYNATNALALNGGSIKNGTGVDVDLLLPVPGFMGSLSYSKNIIINTGSLLPTAPVLEDISPSVDTDGRVALHWDAITGATEYHVYRHNAPITIINGSLTNLTIATIPFANLSTIIGLWYFAITAFNASGESGASNCENVTVAIPIPAIECTDFEVPDGTYGVGEQIKISIYFSEIIYVTGMPQLALETGAIDRIANYFYGNGTPILVFEYYVQMGDYSPDLDYVSTNALFLSGSTIRNGSGTDAILILAPPGTPGSLSFTRAIVIATGPEDSFPLVAFNANVTSICAGMHIQFWDKTTEGDLPLSYQWNFGDGTGDSYEINPIHQYLTAGLYKVFLTVRDADGDTNTTISPLFINVIGGLHDLPLGFDPVNDTMDYNMTGGFDQSVIHPLPHGLSLGIQFNAMGAVTVTVASWRNNPSHVPPPFDKQYEGFYFALEVNDTKQIVFPINITIPLPKGIPKGASVEDIIKSLQICTWNASVGWVGENFNISVNLDKGTMSIMATHLSIFAFGVKPVDDNAMMFWIAIGLVIVGLVAGILAIIKMRGRKKNQSEKEEDVELDFDWDNVDKD